MNWRYLRQGKVRHALSYGTARMAQCGRGPGLWDDWLGTGSQAEYERAAELPTCTRCLKALQLQGVGRD